MGNATESQVVERYLECLAAHDWDGLADTIADEGLTREGPFCDRVDGKAHYVAYLRKVCTSMEGHRLEVQRVSHVDARVLRRADRDVRDRRRCHQVARMHPVRAG